MVAFEIIDTDPVVDQCGYCDNGIQGDQYCRYCGGDGVDVFDRSSLFTLAHNLAIAGGLCASWVLGSNHGYPDECGWDWRPGCGRGPT